MTLDEYRKLSPDEQEDFINSGGVISPSGEKEESKESNVQTDSCVNTQTFPDGSLSSSDATTSSDEVQTGPTDVIGSSLLPNNTEAKDVSVAVVPADASPSAVSSLQTFDVQDPVELLFLLDDTISSGKVKLHEWQIKFLLDFAKGGLSDKQPFQAVVRACNGSGKDKYIIAPSVIWLCMRYFRARGVVTSSSGVQLDNQTCAYITQLAESANRKIAPNIWKCNYRKYECLATQSPIICYATDEAGKAEGFHPLEFGAKMGIFVSEDKTVPDEINVALNKCTGYTHRCHVSTPGNAFGHFFDMCSTAISRSDVKDILDVRAEDYIQYHIKASDCGHLSDAYINQMKRDLPGGEFGAAYKSQVEAEFAVTDEMVVVPYTYIWKAKRFTDEKWIPEEHNEAGLDLSDGGDETVLITRNGNKVLHIDPFRFDNPEDTIVFLDQKFKERGLTHPEAYINGDCGGIGSIILHRLKRMGYSNIRFCDNRAKSSRPKVYKNFAAESWFHLGDLLKQGQIIIPDDAILTRQLSTRYYKLLDGVIHQLLSKVEMRSRGYPSPDRADALVLCFKNYKSNFIPQEIEQPFEEPKEEEKKSIYTTAGVGSFTLKGAATGSSGVIRKYNINNQQQSWSSLEDEVAQHNKSIRKGNV